MPLIHISLTLYKFLCFIRYWIVIFYIRFIWYRAFCWNLVTTILDCPQDILGVTVIVTYNRLQERERKNKIRITLLHFTSFFFLFNMLNTSHWKKEPHLTEITRNCHILINYDARYESWAKSFSVLFFVELMRLFGNMWIANF